MRSKPRDPTPAPDAIRLTQLASAAGCAAKLSQLMLSDVLRLLPRPRNSDPSVLVNASSFDDAGVFRLRGDLALVQTVDFFTPIVDDAYDFGQIAAANALSDVYAMGGRPITAMNLLGVPADRLDAATIARILKGGAAKVRESGASLVGGHTIKTLEPIFGMSITGLVHPKRILTNATARPGDLIVLTKPLGTGIVTTAIKRGLASKQIAARAVRSMTRLNTPGATLAEARLVSCATDITGFGLSGHLGNVVRASEVTAEVDVNRLPLLGAEVLTLIDEGCVPGGTRSNMDAAPILEWGRTSERMRVLLSDAQTSGPLMLFVRPAKLTSVLAILKEHRTLAAAVVGRIVRGRPGIRIV